jgi:superfamily II DNA or RNA helicase
VGAFIDLFNQLDVDERVKGKQFEHICKWFLTNDPVYKHELRRVWLWSEWPGRWGADAGIDLVAEDRNGHSWAIQAKAYDPAYRVTKRDVNKFLAESGRGAFTYRMLIATTNLIDRIGERTIQDQEKRVTFLRLNDLQVANVDWPALPTALRPGRPRKQARPHDYQREAIKKVVGGFDSADRGQLIMACGTGKTLTALFLREKLAAERTLVLVPSLSLLKQTLNVWRANSVTEFASLPVCSDVTVAREDDDVAVSHTSDIGVPVTTDAEEIRAFLCQPGPRVVFATYQSSPQIAEAFALGRLPAFDLVIADEAHRCAGPASSDFATVLSPLKIKAKRRLFMTATPRYFTGRVLQVAEEAEFEYASMDDEAKFGKVFHRLGFAEAIKRDILTDYQVAIVGVDDATYLEWAKNGVLVTRDGVEITDATSLAGQIGLAKAMQNYDLRRVISFHTRVRRAREFAASMPDVLAWMPAPQRPKGELWSRYASGEMPAGDRYVLLQHLGSLDEGTRGLLTNARCLAEGVDVPTLDGVAFIDPRRSEVDIVQAVGRAIRKSDDKTVGTIVIPVFIDTTTDPELALDGSAFKPVWDVIKALRSHDDGLGEQLDELRRRIGHQRAGSPLPDRIHLDVPASVGVDFANAFQVRLVEQTTASWEAWFGLLQRFVAVHGHAVVPQSSTVDGYQLGKWVTKQRAKRAKGSLDTDRSSRLENLPGWTWDPKADQWERAFSRLICYVESSGHACVPLACIVDGYPLGRWVIKQRAKYAQGVLDGDRQYRLQNLPGWTWDTIADKWEEGFRRLVDYVDRSGDARVPLPFVIDGYKLGQWVANQRTKQSNGTLDADHHSRLQRLPGWTWNPFADKWEEGFQQLSEYIRIHGHSNVPAKETFNGYRLGQWATVQRQSYRSGKLDEQRQHRLQEIPEWTWTPIDDLWESGFQHLQQYIETEGNSQVPQTYTAIDGFRLGSWVNTQRIRYRNKTLEVDQLERLSEIPDWSWHALESKWEKGFQYLHNFAEAHGNVRVPMDYEVDGFKLRDWLTNNRAKFDKLSPDRQRLLKSLPGWDDFSHNAKWEAGFQRLLDYVKENGTAAVPRLYVVDGYPLGSWVMTKRQEFNNELFLRSGSSSLLTCLVGRKTPKLPSGRTGSDTSPNTSRRTETPPHRRTTFATGTGSARGSDTSVCRSPRGLLVRSELTDWSRYPPGSGSPRRRSGSRASAAFRNTSTNTVTLRSKPNTPPLMVTGWAHGWRNSGTSSQQGRSILIASCDSTRSRGGNGGSRTGNWTRSPS